MGYPGEEGARGRSHRHQEDWRAPSRRRRRSKLPMIIAGVASVALAIAAGVLVALSGDEQAPAAATAPTTSPTPTKSPLAAGAGVTGEYGFAQSRLTDPLPLALDEVFRNKKITKGGRTYLMTVRRLDKSCAGVMQGTRLLKAIKGAGCTQVLRASFQDSTGKIIGTLGVANLKDLKATLRVQKTQGGTDYLKPLPGKKATSVLGSGEAYAGIWKHGHYAVFVWFGYQDGHRPTAAERKKLNQAAADIAEGTVFPALDSRSLTGARSR
ncbi:hypothetical protein [Rhizohabitans arisaemae]|uniref:hypothetical protein n=1 Tax=Rhizohabitans arisaemae TaxID=2720610 RepID=UPI0024B04402|nr:hypothetical protein [Rhizohabitans arisaemae]